MPYLRRYPGLRKIFSPLRVCVARARSRAPGCCSKQHWHTGGSTRSAVRVTTSSWSRNAFRRTVLKVSPPLPASEKICGCSARIRAGPAHACAWQRTYHPEASLPGPRRARASAAALRRPIYFTSISFIEFRSHKSKKIIFVQYFS